MQTRFIVALALSLCIVPTAAFNVPALRFPSSAQKLDVTLLNPARPSFTGLRMQFADPDGPVKIPDTFNPAEWGRGGGGGLGGGLGGFRVPDTFSPDGLEREKQRGATAVLERPKLDPGKKYKVLLFNDNKNTREYVIDTLIKCIPGMTADKAKEITEEAHTNGLALVGIWMFELAEAYSDVLSSAGLKSDIEEA